MNAAAHSSRPPADPRSGRPRRRARVVAGIAGGAVLAGLAALAVELRSIDVDPPPVDGPTLPRAGGLQPPAPPAAGRRPGQPAMAGAGWRVVGVNSVSGVLLVTVETERLDEMAAIAREVVTPAAARLLEALVYFHRPGAPTAVGRVQWTADRGYVPLRFAE